MCEVDRRKGIFFPKAPTGLSALINKLKLRVKKRRTETINLLIPHRSLARRKINVLLFYDP
ncbi:hypothetical protein DLM75_05225 [Leptospira stimsonii]|uniref:Uncharacterized protein n=1 Tax=Leptospira stimsonii TaxID=2202203 RepID=A0A396ZBB9_9LEPT|nr:hypothetical protein DLM75_05225 [Leptospira stimsonii]